MILSQAKLFIFIFTTLILQSDCTKLTKKYTIRLPMFANLIGRISFDKFCTRPVELLLAKLNENPAVLPDYNLVAEVFDDNCDSAKAARLAVSVLENMRLQQVSFLVNGTLFPKKGNRVIPSNISSETPSAHVAMTTPLMSGPFCTEVCLVMGRFLPLFNSFAISGLCSNPVLDSKKIYRNMYRSFSNSHEYTHARLAMIKELGWTKVGIASDTYALSFDDTRYLMMKLVEAGIEIITEQFFDNNADQAISNLMKAGVRIAFGICYDPTCANLGCSIAKMKYYGPNMVWIFPSYFNIPMPNGIPSGCTKDMFHEFKQQHSLFFGPDFSGLAGVPVSEIGLTKTEVNGYLKETLSKADYRPPVRQVPLVCLQTVEASVFVLDAAEKRLNQNNKTLMDFKNADEIEWNKLGDVIESAIKDMNSSGLMGITNFLPGTRRASSPAPLILQMKGKTRSPIAAYRIPENRLVYLNKFSWLTSDGKPPTSVPPTVVECLTVPNWTVIFVKFVAVIFIIAYVTACAFLIKYRKHRKVIDCFYSLNMSGIFGVLLMLTALLLYPHGQNDENMGGLNMDLFCKAGPALVVIGYAIVIGSIVFKGLTRFSVEIIGPIHKHGKLQITGFLCFLVWVALNTLLFLVLFFLAGTPPTGHEVSKNMNDDLALWKVDVLRINKWKRCRISDDYRIGTVIIALQVLMGFIGVMLSTFGKYHVGRVFIADTRAYNAVMNLLAPITIVCLAALFSIDSYATDFAALTTFCIVNAAVIFTVYSVYFFTKRLFTKYRPRGAYRFSK